MYFYISIYVNDTWIITRIQLASQRSCQHGPVYVIKLNYMAKDKIESRKKLD